MTMMMMMAMLLITSFKLSMWMRAMPTAMPTVLLEFWKAKNYSQVSENRPVSSIFYFVWKYCLHWDNALFVVLKKNCPEINKNLFVGKISAWATWATYLSSKTSPEFCLILRKCPGSDSDQKQRGDNKVETRFGTDASLKVDSSCNFSKF